MADNNGSDADEKLLRQKKFYLFMSPFEGHDLAEKYGNFHPPSPDIMESEMKDTLTVWLQVQQSSAGEILADSAWWMMRLLDPEGRKGADESMEILDGLTSFGMSIIGQLLDLGLIQMTEDIDIPTIIASSDLQFSEDDFSFLKTLEAIWEDKEDDE